MIRKFAYKALQALSNRANQLHQIESGWDASEALYAKMYLDKIERTFAEKFSGGGSLKILDAGCGTGTTALALAAKGNHVTGIEIHRPSVETARAHARDKGLSIDILQGDLLGALKQEPHNKYDVCVCLGVLYTCANYAEILAEFQRVLRPRGVLIASFRTPFYFVTTLLRAGNFKAARSILSSTEGVLRIASMPTYYNWQTPPQLRALLQEMEFDDVRLEAHGLFTGADDDGMAAVADVNKVPKESLFSSIYELEMEGLPECLGASRFMLAIGHSRSR